ncbi:MAG: FapA family protein, partial [Candidatus Sumerlaeota bacterium]
KRVRSRISVDKVKYIRGDVDFRSGSIQFKGDVVVDGDVKETFDIEAEGSIRIGGTVDRAALKAGGDILIDGGLYGKDDIEVLAEGDISLGFAENANLKAGGDIYVKSALVNCDTLSQQKIHLKATGKALIGGHTIATHGLDANSLGNPRIPTKTLIEFGLRPELSQKLRGLKLEFQRSDEARQKEIREEIGSLAEEYELQTRARVIARHITYPGVILVCEKASFEVYNEISRMMYYKVKGKNEISMRGYGPAKKTALKH